MIKRWYVLLACCLSYGYIYSMKQEELEKKLYALDEQEKQMKEESNKKYTQLLQKIQMREQQYQTKVTEIQQQQAAAEEFSKEAMEKVKRIINKS